MAKKWFKQLYKTVPLRWVLIIPFTLQTILAGSVVGYLSYRNGQEKVVELADQLMEQTGNLIGHELEKNLEIAKMASRTNISALAAGYINALESKTVEHFYIEQLKLMPTISSLGLINENRELLIVERLLPDALIIRRFKPKGNDWGLYRYIGDENGQNLVLKDIRHNYDPHHDPPENPFYERTKRSAQGSWQLSVSPALEQKSPILQLLYTVPFKNNEGKLQGVSVSSIHLTELGRFLEQFKVSKNGQVFVIERNGLLVATSTKEVPFYSKPNRNQAENVAVKPRRLSAENSENLLTKYVAHYVLNDGAVDILNAPRSFHLRLHQQGYFVRVVPLTGELNWLAIVVAPEADFKSTIWANNRRTLVLCILTLLGSIASGVVIANRLTARISRINRTSQELAAGDLNWQLPGDSSIAELGELTESFNRMAKQVREMFQQRVEIEAAYQIETRFQQLAEAVPGMIYTYTQYPDGSHKFEYVSSVSRRILEMEPREILGDINKVLQQIHPEDRNAHNEAVARSAETLEPFSFAFRNITPSGQLKWLEASSCPLQQANGAITWYGILLDVSVAKLREAERKAAEIALRQSQTKFSTIFYDNPQPAWIATLKEGRCLEVNQSFCNVLGYSAEEVLGKTCREIELWDDLNDLQHFRQTLSERSTIYDFEVVFRTKSGQRKTVLLSARVRDLEGEYCVMGVLSDISDRKALEDALQEKELKVKDILNSTLAAIASMRVFPDGRWEIDQVSEGCEAISGFTSEELTADNNLWLERIEPDDWRQVESLVFANIFAGRTGTYEYRLHHKNGDIRWISQRNNSCWDDLEQCWVVTAISVDITARKQAEIALENSESRLRKLAEASPAVIYTVVEDPDRGLARFEYISRAAETIHEIPLAFLRQKATLISEQIHPNDRADYWRAVKGSLESMEPFNHEWRIITPSGKVKCLQANSRPERRDNGEVYWYGIVIDISDRKKTEEELQRAKEAAETASQAKSIFLANMSHELRTPLNCILGFSQLMELKSDLSQNEREYLKLIRNNGNLLLKLINEILDLSKIEAGKLSLKNQALDLFEQLHLISDTLSERLHRKNLAFYVEIEPAVPRYIVIDGQKLEQILLNLLSNAIKFTDRGKIVLRVSTRSSFNPGICFQVEDTGAGIAPEDLEVIFDAFVQTSAGQRIQEGTGLGLTICKRLVQLMGGELKVDSVLQRGSTFEFQLPLEVATEVNNLSLPGSRPVIGLIPGQPGYRILIVDDRSDNRLLLVKMFQRLRLEVQEAGSGEEAIELWQRWHPHLIWMDVRLHKGIDGYETTRRIRELERWQSSWPTVIIALTAQALPGEQNLALTAGCDDYISKPFLEETLFAKMEEHLGIGFVYSEETFLKKSNRNSKPLDLLLASKELALMPREWVRALHRASILGEAMGVNQLLEEIPEEYCLLAHTLKELVKKFDFQKIMELTQTRSG